MIRWLAQQPYLAANLIALVTVAFALIPAQGERGRTLLAGAVALAGIPLGPHFDGSYWEPSRLGGHAGPLEDSLYLMTVGCRAWLCALAGAAFLPGRAWPWALARATVATSAAFAAFAGMTLAGLAAGEAVLGLCAVAIAVLLYRDPAQWRAAASSALLCGLWFTVELRLWFALWPEMAAWWTPGAWTTRPLLGVPVGDILTAALAGPAHALTLAWVLGGRFVARDRA